MCLRIFAFQLFLYIGPSRVLLDLDAPAGHWVEGWRADSLAATEIEASMVPRTTNRVVHEEAAGARGAP